MRPAIVQVEDKLLDDVPLSVLTSVLGYLDSADELGTEPTVKERMLMDLLDRIEDREVEIMAMVRVMWISQITVVYAIATDNVFHDGHGRERLRSRVRGAKLRADLKGEALDYDQANG